MVKILEIPIQLLLIELCRGKERKNSAFSCLLFQFLLVRHLHMILVFIIHFVHAFSRVQNQAGEFCGGGGEGNWWSSYMAECLILKFPLYFYPQYRLCHLLMKS